jgi:hypothetical protein
MGPVVELVCRTWNNSVELFMTNSSRLRLSRRALSSNRLLVFAAGLFITLSLSLNLSLSHAASSGLADHV